MKRKIKLTESELRSLIRSVINEGFIDNFREKRRLKKDERAKQRLTPLAEKYLSRINQARSLFDCFDAHVEMWREGLQIPNLGPNEYGIFRTEDISTMQPEEVFLGGVYGLWTYPLTKWESMRSKDPSAYRTVLQQYKKLLISNLEAFISGWG